MAKSVLLRDGMNLIRLSSEVFDNVSHLVCVWGGAAVSKMMYKFVLLSPLWDLTFIRFLAPYAALQNAQAIPSFMIHFPGS